MENSKTCSFGKLIGRVLLSIIFLVSGIGKFVDFDAAKNYMAAAGIPMASYFLVAAALVEILGGLSLLLGYRARIGALVLILFLIPVTGIFHNFWELDGMARQAMTAEFLKNLAIIGGLFYVLATGPGCLSCCKGRCSLEDSK